MYDNSHLRGLQCCELYEEMWNNLQEGPCEVTRKLESECNLQTYVIARICEK